MKLLLYCLAALFAATLAAIDVEKTVKQVQAILKSNSLLPRLSRDEIIQLLNDIKAEDAKSKSSSTENSRESKEILTTPAPINVHENEINSTRNLSENEKDQNVFVTASTTQNSIETTTKAEPSVMVVLPYTPRDGASLQELYTRPPRIELVPQSREKPRPFQVNPSRETHKSNAKVSTQKKEDLSAELQAFLDAHGLKGNPGQDSFLLPLEGFKPLPAPKVIDGTVQLPENILLTYDLISPTDLKKESDNEGAQSAVAPTNYLYEPLRPELPYELDTSSSELDKSVLPLDMPKKKKTKSATQKTTFAPVDYDSIKVIPLNQGPNPFEEEKVALESEQSKRQVNSTTESSTGTDISDAATTKETNEPKDAITNAPPADSAADNTDAGASISDLEDSFGGAAAEQPGDSELPKPKKNGFYWMLDWNSFLEVGDDENPRRVNIRFEPKLGDPQMFIPVSVP